MVMIGYARAEPGTGSADEVGRQLSALRAAGCRQVFADVASSRVNTGAGLAAAIDHVGRGGTLAACGRRQITGSWHQWIVIEHDLDSRGASILLLDRSASPLGRCLSTADPDHAFLLRVGMLGELYTRGRADPLADAREREESLQWWQDITRARAAGRMAAPWQSSPSYPAIWHIVGPAGRPVCGQATRTAGGPVSAYLVTGKRCRGGGCRKVWEQVDRAFPS
jgi:hypothetical protein